MREFGFADDLERAAAVQVLEPLGYLEFLDLTMQAKPALPDSGGIQEETTILGMPCLMFRTNKEPPVTITEGTNLLVRSDPGRIIAAVEALLAGQIPELWEGRAAERIVSIFRENFAWA